MIDVRCPDLSDHVIQRIREMGVTVHAVADTYLRPNWITLPIRYPNRLNFTSDHHDLTLVVGLRGSLPEIITALPSSRQGWRRLRDAGRLAEDRSFRELFWLRERPTDPFLECA